ncbi:hypothetical protein M0804_014177 [Polistes exclamans]|nr:hypothetical protein M0804_014179 [Polistes exclamans]KAI4475642.1 hypothetical protein M0804_014177 [Polistes exclamans]
MGAAAVAAATGGWGVEVVVVELNMWIEDMARGWISVEGAITLPPPAEPTSPALMRAPTAMEFHPRRCDINLRRINAPYVGSGVCQYYQFIRCCGQLRQLLPQDMVIFKVTEEESERETVLARGWGDRVGGSIELEGK